MKRAIIFDSGVLISFTSSGLLPELIELKKIFKGNFLITEQVKTEVIDKPLKIKRFELSALKLEHLLNLNALQLPSRIGIKENEIQTEVKNILEISNNTFFEKSKAIKIIHDGEASCLALSKLLSAKNIKNVIAIDERTTRILGENPESLRQLLQKKLHTKITANEKNYDFFKYFKFIRSAELVYVAYKKGIIRFKQKKALDAMLFAVKFSGAAISSDEIEEIKKLK